MHVLLDMTCSRCMGYMVRTSLSPSPSSPLLYTMMVNRVNPSIGLYTASAGTPSVYEDAYCPDIRYGCSTSTGTRTSKLTVQVPVLVLEYR